MCECVIANNGANWDGVQAKGKSETTKRLRYMREKTNVCMQNGLVRLHVLTIGGYIVKICNFFISL